MCSSSCLSFNLSVVFFEIHKQNMVVKKTRLKLTVDGNQRIRTFSWGQILCTALYAYSFSISFQPMSQFLGTIGWRNKKTSLAPINNNIIGATGIYFSSKRNGLTKTLTLQKNTLKSLSWDRCKPGVKTLSDKSHIFWIWCMRNSHILHLERNSLSNFLAMTIHTHIVPSKITTLENCSHFWWWVLLASEIGDVNRS